MKDYFRALMLVSCLLIFQSLCFIQRTIAADTQPVVRQITQGPGFYWFGYYDKWQFDPTDRFVLAMRADFEGRSPRPDDTIEIGMVDLGDNDRWINLGRSGAWSWQQGCMLQWRPGSMSEVVWNDREGDHFVCRVMDVLTREIRTIPNPIYALSPDGKTAVTADFRRIQDTRPGYGYAGLSDPYKSESAPQQSGIWRVDLDTGSSRLIVSLADIAALPHEFGEPGEFDNAKHWFNHLLFNTDGTRFVFLHRWKPADGSKYRGVGGFGTRMLTANPDGSDIRIVDPYGKTSHFIWRDPSHILAWAWHPSHQNAFYLYEDGSEDVQIVGQGIMTLNGHCTYLPNTDNQWILNDTYPDSNRNQNVYLYHISTNERIWLGHFNSPKSYQGEWRCDTHPRYSHSGRRVCIDSTHTNAGRQLFLIDMDHIFKAKNQ